MYLASGAENLRIGAVSFLYLSKNPVHASASKSYKWGDP